MECTTICRVRLTEQIRYRQDECPPFQHTRHSTPHLHPHNMVTPSEIRYPLFPPFVILAGLLTCPSFTVVVDEEVAFLGGIDLCYTRYDDERYIIVDPKGETYPGRYHDKLGAVCPIYSQIHKGLWQPELCWRE